MASTANPPKPMQRNTHPSRPMRRSIVPVIPLTFQKRKPQEPTRPKVQEAPVAVAQPKAEVEALKIPTPPPAEPVSSIASVSLDDHVSEKAEESIASSPLITPATPATPTKEESIKENAVEEAKVEVVNVEEKRAEFHVLPTYPPSDNQSSGSRSTYQMPPAFVPASQSNGANSATSQPSEENIVINNQRLHHTQPSSGNVMFIGYPESDNSSPAPLSAGNAAMTFYEAPYSAGRQAMGYPHLNSGPPGISNGYAPMGPPPPGFFPRHDGYNNQDPTSENYGRRPLVNFGMPEAYPNSGTPQGGDGYRMHNYDPITPRSYHGGSQSSVHNDHDSAPAYYPQFPPPGLTNGASGHIDDARYQQQRIKPHFSSQQTAPPQNNFGHQMAPPLPPVDHLDGLVMYIHSQYGDPTFADYILELRYLDDRAQPSRIHGHSLIFARSPTLKNYMFNERQVDQSAGPGPRTLLISSNDRFLRTDAFSLALSRLYGGPLLDTGALTTLNLSSDVSAVSAGTIDRFDLALGYAAAGKLLQIPPCINRGVEVAGHLIKWETMEKALDFALDGGLDSQWTLQPQEHCPSTYGPAVNMLIDVALNYMINNFPPAFKLETSIDEPARNRRLPTVQDPRSSSQNPRLSFIKFGDHPTEESVRTVSADPVKITLSKILLNLPHELLKFVLKSPRLGNVDGWASAKVRGEVLDAVVQEREQRRLRVLGATFISNETRQNNFREWESVGWREYVENMADGTTQLSRAWVGFDGPVSDN